MKLSTVLKYCKEQAKISRSNYDSTHYYNQDVNFRNKSRLRAIKLARKHLLMPITIWGQTSEQELVPGQSSNGRLVITENSVEYTTGQYTPTEIYDALYSYILNTYSNNKGV